MSLIAELRWSVFGVAAGACALVALIGGLLTDPGGWYQTLRAPAWRPPTWAFGPAWTLIFLLIALGGAFAWQASPDTTTRVALIALFAINGALNIAWSGLFFKLRRPDWAFVELVFLWMSILSLVVFAARLSGVAAGLLAPYLAWVTFAGALNRRIVVLNAPFGRGAESLNPVGRQGDGRNHP